MAEVYRATAKFLERRYEFKRSLRSALITPLVTVLVLNAAVIWYVAYIFPATAELFLRYNMKLPPMTQFTLDMSYWLQANVWYLIAAIVIPIIAGIFTYQTSTWKSVVR